MGEYYNKSEQNNFILYAFKGVDGSKSESEKKEKDCAIGEIRKFRNTGIGISAETVKLSPMENNLHVHTETPMELYMGGISPQVLPCDLCELDKLLC